MGRAVVLNTGSVASATGGTFADTLTINSGDSLAVANFETGAAKVIEAWAGNSAHGMEGQWIYTRPQSTHDQSHGFRFQIPALYPTATNSSRAHNILPGGGGIDVFKSDSPTIQFSCTASDGICMSWQTLYDDLPGVSAVMADWAQVQALKVSTLGIFVNAVASATVGAYGTARAFNADDDRLHANTWYAILGANVRIPVTTISLLGPDWGGQRIGMPMGVLDLRSDMWFVDQTIKWGIPLIPVFNSNNKGNVLIQIADTNASTTPSLDFLLFELRGKPGG